MRVDHPAALLSQITLVSGRAKQDHLSAVGASPTNDPNWDRSCCMPMHAGVSLLAPAPLEGPLRRVFEHVDLRAQRHERMVGFRRMSSPSSRVRSVLVRSLEVRVVVRP